MVATTTLLIVDDQPENLDVLVDYLGNSGFNLSIATNGEDAIDIAQKQKPDLVLLDVMMPGLNGFDVCQRLKASEITAQVPIIFMSALNDTESKLQGFSAGAIDFITKPLQRQEVLARINAHLTIARQQQQLRDKNLQLENLNRELAAQIARRQQAELAKHLADETLSALTKQEAEHWGLEAFIGQSDAISRLLDEVRSLQLSTYTNVVVLGESGTGKELVSRAIHFGSDRRGKPFVAVNCSAIPAELADAEFFGHTKGAYTGATSDRYGYFEKADGGTLFLDEIGDMPLQLQAKLLRVLEDGLVTPIGGRQARRVNVRVVAATNVDIRTRVKEKQFRQDLYFRLAGYQLTLPPLRFRGGDIQLLTEHFLERLSRQMGRERPAITANALRMLGRYHYPGNVRELKNIIEYSLIASRGQPIDVKHLHFMEMPLQDDLPAVNAEQGVTLPAAEPALASQSDKPLVSDETMLLEYVKKHGRIDNTLAQRVLGADHGRASYLLKKLHKDGHLQIQGQRRWAYYTL